VDNGRRWPVRDFALLSFQSNRSINRPLLSTALTRKSGYRLLSDLISIKTTCELLMLVMW
jgi:hypothetical protein